MRRLAGMLGLLLLLGGCTLASPYSAAIDGKAAEIYEQVLEFRAFMRVNAGTPKGDPRSEENRRRFDRWIAALETMELRSAALAPASADCRRFLETLSAGPQRDALGGLLSAITSEPPVGGQAGDAPIDCQTLVVRRTREGLERAQDRYRLACTLPPDTGEDAPARPTGLTQSGRTAEQVRMRCRGLFTPASPNLPAEVQTGLFAPTLTNLETIIRIQAVKKPKEA